jgi:hypothetical protein
MGQGWSGGPNECLAYFKARNPGMYTPSIELWCDRWFLDNKARADYPRYKGKHGWGYPSTNLPDLPYIDEYESFNDVAGKFFGGRRDADNDRCYAQSRKYYGMDYYAPDLVEWKYCFGKEDTSLDDCGGGFFGNLGCAIENVGGSFGDFVTDTLPNMFRNGLDALGAGTEFIAWFLANWIWVLGVVAVIFVVGFLIWSWSSLRGR